MGADLLEVVTMKIRDDVYNLDIERLIQYDEKGDKVGADIC